MAAQDLERLVVQLSADFKSYENAMARASGITRKELAQIKADAANAGNGAAAAFGGASVGARKFGSEASRATAQVRALQGQTGNLAAQINDIGVQLAGGQSPFLIALQQGTQINQVLGGAGARGAVGALAGAFTSLLNPVSLATIGIIAAGGAAIQYFSGLIGDGEKSADELKKQSDLIQQVAKDWGDAVPALKAYADELQRAAKLAELQEATSARVAAIRQGLSSEVGGLDLGGLFDSALDSLQTGDLALTGAIGEVTAAFSDLDGKARDGTATVQDFERVQAALASLTKQEATPATEAFAVALGIAASQASGATSEIARLEGAVASASSTLQKFNAAQAASMAAYRTAAQAGSDFVAEQERLNGLTGEQLRLENEIARTREAINREGGIATPDQIEALAQSTIAAEERRAAAAREAAKAARGGGKSEAQKDAEKNARDLEREREAVVKLIEALQFEQSLIGMTDVEREKANATRRAGAAATDEQRAQIEALVTQSYEMTEALRQTEEQMEALKGLSADVLQGLADDLIDGASAADVLNNALTRIGTTLLNSGIDAFIEGAFASRSGPVGGGLLGGRIIPGILHSGGTVGRDGYSGRSVPTSVFAGARRYHSGGMVGLMPGEVPIIAQRGERVLSRAEVARSAGGSTHITVDVTGARGNTEIMQMVEAGIRRATPGIQVGAVRAVQSGVKNSRKFLGG